MQMKTGSHCILLSPEDVAKFVQFFSLFIDIDQKLKKMKKLIANITSILQQRVISKTKHSLTINS